MEGKKKTLVISDEEEEEEGKEGKNETQVTSDEMKMKVKNKTQVTSDDEEEEEGKNETQVTSDELTHLDEADSSHSRQKKRSRQWHQEVEGKRRCLSKKKITSPKIPRWPPILSVQ